MAFKRSQFYPLERAEAVDLIRTNDSAWSNLVQALKRFVRTGNGIAYGCNLSAPGGKFVTVAAGAVMADGGPILFDTDTTLPVPDNTSGDDRIDLIVAGPYTDTDGTNEARDQWDDSTQTAFSTPLNTEKLSGPTAPTLIQGIPAGSPTAPAVPTGAVSLGTVYVADGFTNIILSNLTETEESKIQAIRLAKGSGVWGNYSFDYSSASDTLPYTIKLKLDAGRLSLVLGSLEVRSQDLRPPSISFTIQASGLFGGVAGEAHYPWIQANGGTTIWCMGFAVGNGLSYTYSLKLQRMLTSVMMPGNQVLDTAENIQVQLGKIVIVSL